MPFVAGGNLQQRIDRVGPLPLIEILSVGVQIAEALVAAHRLGLVHRDIKPANILLDDGGHRVLLSDFGLARRSPSRNPLAKSLHPPTTSFSLGRILALGFAFSMILFAYFNWPAMQREPSVRSTNSFGVQGSNSTTKSKSISPTIPDEMSFDSDIPNRLNEIESKLRAMRAGIVWK